MPESNLANYKDLLTEFKRLPPSPREFTFMQVAGYPHYENVCSNILAFYLDPQEEHGLGDLVLRSAPLSTGTPPQRPADHHGERDTSYARAPLSPPRKQRRTDL